jgi:hypothetical protein
MTVMELASSVGKTVYFVAGDLRFTCKVLDARMIWGKPQFQIRPMDGTGTRWIEFSSIEPIACVATRYMAPVPPAKKSLLTTITSAIVGSR